MQIMHGLVLISLNRKALAINKNKPPILYLMKIDCAIQDRYYYCVERLSDKSFSTFKVYA